MENTVQTVFVAVGEGYPVRIGGGLLETCGELLRERLPQCRLAVVTDETVAALYLESVTASLCRVGFSVCTYVLPAGEGSKSLAVLSGLLDFLAAEQLTRADGILALGGGVVGDLAGFAAAVYLRGIRWVQLPTTLLSAVDSSVGGKTAVDLRAGKNLAGAFWQPSAVLCDTDVLSALPGPVFADGAAEAVKTAVLSGEPLFSLLSGGAPRQALPTLVFDCVSCKARIVEADPLDRGERRLLNLGHTAGHAIEVCSGYTVSHGRAVAAGLGLISRAAERLGWAHAPVAAPIVAALSANGLPTGTDIPAAVLARAALSDKKRAGDTITLAIPRNIGMCALKEIPAAELEAVFAAGREV